MKQVRALKILFLAANPEDTDRLRLDEEIRSIDEALRKAKFRDQYEIVQHWAVRVADLQECLLRHQPDIVHFSGHGSKSDGIILEDQDDGSHPVSTRALARVFELLKDNIRCVVLNACYSAEQANAITEHVDCVVGMSKAVGDEAAIAFATAFYQALGYGRDVKTAFDLGCSQIDLKGLDEQDTPQLKTRSGIDPQKIVFVRHEAALEANRPAPAISHLRHDFYHNIYLPTNYVPREGLLAELRAALLSSANAVALISAIKAKPTALHGMGGIGKSVMARALCDDPQIQAAFPHGILWATLGKEPNVSEQMRHWINALGGIISETAPTEEQLKANLAKLLAERACLLIVDDVWRRKHAEAFRLGGERCCLLLTTRDQQIAQEMGANVQPVPLMAPDEALRLLEEWANGKLESVSSELKAQIVKRLGYLPLAVRLAGAQLQRKSPQEWLARFDVHQLKAKRLEEVHDSLEKTFELSMVELNEEQRRLYLGLAIFKKDEKFPEVAIQKLWQALADYDNEETASLVEDLAARALLSFEEDEQRRSIGFHSLMRDLIVVELGEDDQLTIHETLLKIYRQTCKGEGWHTAPDDGYLYDHLIYHLHAAERFDEIKRLFQDQNWMNVRVPQRQYEYDGYLNDLMVGWQNAHEEAKRQIATNEMPSAFAACVRYALIRTSVNSIAANYVPALVARAVKIGLWSARRALSIAAKVPDNEQRARLCVALLATDRLDQNSKRFAQELSLATARLIANEGARAQVLSALALQLTGEAREQVLSEALAMARVIKYEKFRAEVLLVLAPQLTGESLREALLVARAIENEGLRVEVLSAMTPQLIGEAREEVLREALITARAIKNEGARANALLKLVPQLTNEVREKVLREVLAAARAIEHEKSRAEVLSALAPHLKGECLEEALMAAKAIEYEVFRAEVLSALVPQLAIEAREQILQEAIALTMAIKNEGTRVKLLFTLVPLLPIEAQKQILREILATRAIDIDYEWSHAGVLSVLVSQFTGEGQEQILRDAMAAVRAIKGEQSRAEALSVLALQFTGEAREQVLREALALAIKDEESRAEALSVLAPRLTDESLREALAVRAIDDEPSRARVLSALSPQLTDVVREQVLQETLVAVRAIDDEGCRAEVLSALVPQLTGNR